MIMIILTHHIKTESKLIGKNKDNLLLGFATNINTAKL